MLLHVSSDSMAAVVFPFAETVVTVKVLTTPVGAMSLVFCGKTAMLLQDSERLDHFVECFLGWYGGGGLPECGDY